MKLLIAVIALWLALSTGLTIPAVTGNDARRPTRALGWRVAMVKPGEGMLLFAFFAHGFVRGKANYLASVIQTDGMEVTIC